LNEHGFDGRGNYNLGLKDQLIFPEIDYDMITKVRGLNITVVTSSSSDAQALSLLKKLGFPFVTKAIT
jgi:large subunit ribosomal protein L5